MAKTSIIRIIPGEIVSFQGINYKIKRVLDFDHFLLESTLNKNLLTISRNEIQPAIDENSDDNNTKRNDIIDISEQDWAIARKRFDIIKPIIDGNLSGEKVSEIAKLNGIHRATIYRWIKKYFYGGESISSLLDEGRTGGKDKGRLSDEVESIIEAVIENKYLTRQRIIISKACEEVKFQSMM